MLIEKVTISALYNVAERKHYKIFEKGLYNLNIWGVRSLCRKAGRFDDVGAVIFKNSRGVQIFKFPMTTDPGRYYLAHLLNKNGAAILKEDQHRSCWRKGLHRGKYEALVQKAPMTVLRDYNRNDVLDFSGKEYTGIFGINLHRASSWKVLEWIGKYSAGCQVIQDPEDFKMLMRLINKAIEYGGWPNSFSYTLINEKDLL